MSRPAGRRDSDFGEEFPDGLLRTRRRGLRDRRSTVGPAQVTPPRAAIGAGARRRDAPGEAMLSPWPAPLRLLRRRPPLPRPPPPPWLPPAAGGRTGRQGAFRRVSRRPPPHPEVRRAIPRRRRCSRRVATSRVAAWLQILRRDWVCAHLRRRCPASWPWSSWRSETKSRDKASPGRPGRGGALRRAQRRRREPQPGRAAPCRPPRPDMRRSRRMEAGPSAVRRAAAPGSSSGRPRRRPAADALARVPESETRASRPTRREWRPGARSDLRRETSFAALGRLDGMRSFYAAVRQSGSGAADEAAHFLAAAVASKNRDHLASAMVRVRAVQTRSPEAIRASLVRRLCVAGTASAAAAAASAEEFYFMAMMRRAAEAPATAPATATAPGGGGTLPEWAVDRLLRREAGSGSGGAFAPGQLGLRGLRAMQPVSERGTPRAANFYLYYYRCIAMSSSGPETPAVTSWAPGPSACWHCATAACHPGP